MTPAEHRKLPKAGEQVWVRAEVINAIPGVILVAFPDGTESVHVSDGDWKPADFARHVQIEEMEALEKFWDREGVDSGDAWNYMLDRLAALRASVEDSGATSAAKDGDALSAELLVKRKEK